MKRLIAIAGLVTAATGCGSSETYSVEEAVSAFARQGYALVEPELPGFRTASFDGAMVVPRSGQPFFVLVVPNDDAEDAWSEYETHQVADSFDARRANVLVISDEGLSARHRKRVLAALGSLPDRDMPVTVAK